MWDKGHYLPQYIQFWWNSVCAEERMWVVSDCTKINCTKELNSDSQWVQHFTNMYGFPPTSIVYKYKCLSCSWSIRLSPYYRLWKHGGGTSSRHLAQLIIQWTHPSGEDARFEHPEKYRRKTSRMSKGWTFLVWVQWPAGDTDCCQSDSCTMWSPIC